MELKILHEYIPISIQVIICPVHDLAGRGDIKPIPRIHSNFSFFWHFQAIFTRAGVQSDQQPGG